MEIVCKPGDNFSLSVELLKEDGTPARVENPVWSQVGNGGSLYPDASDFKVARFETNTDIIGTNINVITFTCDADLDAGEVRELTAYATFVIKEEEAQVINLVVSDPQ